MVAELFIEILVEELPALPFLREFKNFETKWQKVLENYHIQCEVEFFYTPRRVVLFSKQFPVCTQEQEIEIFGPPVVIAFQNGDKNSSLSPAGESFLKKNYLTKEELKFADKGGREVLFAIHKEKGIETKRILEEILKNFLESLHFGKHMRWGEVKEGFIRPIRNVMIFLGEEFIPFHAYGIISEPKTQFHRDFGFTHHTIKNFMDYCQKLEQYGVMLDQNKRREKILSSIASLEQSQGFFVELDEELLDEVVAITEYPCVILGSFPQDALELPKEVIITSMKENQRYFAVYKDKDLQNLKNAFVMVSNSTSKDEDIIIEGNEKVLKARLKDAMFFYHNDLKNKLSNKGLEKLIFIEGAGNVSDKVEREKKIAEFLIEKFGDSSLKEKKSDILEAISLSKADLLSEMVYEFSNLQGIMGYYYAQAMGKSCEFAMGIKEQYLPTGEYSALPSSAFSAIMALAHKLDNILTLFFIGKIPTGSKDPFALRRAAIGVLRIILQEKFDFELTKDFHDLLKILQYENLQAQKITSFFIERMDSILQQNPALLKSVLATGEENVCRIFEKTKALGEIFLENNREQSELIATFKRVANILKTQVLLEEISPSLLQENAEKILYENYLQVCQKAQDSNYLTRLKDLCGLKPSLDDFFEKVMVNVEDTALKNNRIQLIAHIYQEFLQIADIKEISFIR